MFKEAESRPDKIKSTSNNVQVRKKQQHRRRACDLLASLKCLIDRLVNIDEFNALRLDLIMKTLKFVSLYLYDYIFFIHYNGLLD